AAEMLPPKEPLPLTVRLPWMVALEETCNTWARSAATTAFWVVRLVTSSWVGLSCLSATCERSAAVSGGVGDGVGVDLGANALGNRRVAANPMPASTITTTAVATKNLTQLRCGLGDSVLLGAGWLKGVSGGIHHSHKLLGLFYLEFRSTTSIFGVF